MGYTNSKLLGGYDARMKRSTPLFVCLFVFFYQLLYITLHDHARNMHYNTRGIITQKSILQVVSGTHVHIHITARKNHCQIPKVLRYKTLTTLERLLL